MTTCVVDVWALACVTGRSLAERGWVLEAEVPSATTDVPVVSVRVIPSQLWKHQWCEVQQDVDSSAIQETGA